MSYIKQIDTTTVLTKQQVQTVVTLFYKDKQALNKVMLAFISDQVGILNNVVYGQGDLVVVLDTPTSAYLNDNGDLILSDPASEKYSIDSNGHLIYTP